MIVYEFKSMLANSKLQDSLLPILLNNLVYTGELGLSVQHLCHYIADRNVECNLQLCQVLNYYWRNSTPQLCACVCVCEEGGVRAGGNWQLFCHPCVHKPHSYLKEYQHHSPLQHVLK